MFLQQGIFTRARQTSNKRKKVELDTSRNKRKEAQAAFKGAKLFEWRPLGGHQTCSGNIYIFSSVSRVLFFCGQLSEVELRRLVVPPVASETGGRRRYGDIIFEIMCPRRYMNLEKKEEEEEEEEEEGEDAIIF
ncbi:hypothetical protein E2C01_016800 [Portunus trituberculatus]|uniref:Uncharacterized protein n=1 Tax=Portunus trituberculatus TaxID=210409 RepID=A0A5B7DQD4_PORTR|nr:hypothetical protein [Portunus trituberculatus]